MLRLFSKTVNRKKNKMPKETKQKLEEARLELKNRKIAIVIKKGESSMVGWRKLESYIRKHEILNI